MRRPTTPSPLYWLSALFFLFGGLLQSQTPGQPPLEACKPGGFTVIGYPGEFASKTDPSFDVAIDERFEGEFLTLERIWKPAIERTVGKWNGVAGSAWSFRLQGVTGEPASPFDGRTTIAACGGVFLCPSEPPIEPPIGPGGDVIDIFPQTVLAVTLILDDRTADRAIADSDIFFNPLIPFALDPNDGQIDFETVLLHELGHALGLDHNDNCTAEPTVMESVVDLNERKRDLSPEELEGVRFLYPGENESSVRLFESDRALRFDAQIGQPPPFEQEVRLFGPAQRRWSAATDAEWVRIEPPAGRFRSADAIRVFVDQSGLQPGLHEAELSIVDEAHGGPPAVVRVAFEVRPAAPSGPSPSLLSAGIVNGANQRSQRLAPGSLVTVFGTGLATAVAEATGLPLPARLGGVETLINGVPAPLLFVSPGQINAIVPSDAYSGRGGVIVRTGLGQSRQTPVELLPAAPEFFLVDGRHALAIDSDGALNSSDNPARRGDLVTVFLTGQGPVDPPVPSGAPAPSGPPARVVASSRAWLGGQPAELLFVGLAPGFAGLAQANLLVPEGLSGELSLTLEIGGEQSGAAFLWVR